MKKTHSYRALGLVIVLALVLALLGSVAPVALGETTPPGVGVTVTEVEGNSPTHCPEGCGGHFYYRASDPTSGTYQDTREGVTYLEVTFDVHQTDMGPTVDWVSNFPVTCVVVKGGDNYNLYAYDEPVTGDTGLHAPQNCGAPEDGGRAKYCGLSHIDFCYDIPLEVSKTAETSFKRTYTWDIDKVATPDEWDLFCGDSGTSKYDVTATRTDTDSDWAVEGIITIHNPASVAAEITGVSDVVSPDIPATIANWEIDGVPVTSDPVFPLTLAAGSTLTGEYTASLPDGTTRTNTATVTTSEESDVIGGEGTADVEFDLEHPDVEEGYKEVDVDDSYAGEHHFTGTDTWTYERTFTCDGDCEGDTYENIATIRQTEQEARESVDVDCYELTASKDAHTTYTRQYFWDIDKTADPDELTLAVGQHYDGLVNYAVSAWITGHEDSEWAVSGNIYVVNDTPLDATINSVSDEISGIGEVPCDCAVEFPYTLAAGGTLTCSYSKDLPDGTARTNTATVVQQNYDYDWELNATEDGTTTLNPTKAFDFDHDPDEEIDECVDVTDSYYGYLGEACFGETLPKYFFYDRGGFGGYELCGDYEVPNTAYLYTNDTSPYDGEHDPVDQASETVVIHVPCDGCTLTQGYWKTHSKYGPAAHPDDTWDLVLPDGPDTLFFSSGQSYYQVLWTQPAGNAYYVLAHQYIAAQLNMLNGASAPTEVLSAFNSATDWFEAHDPADGEHLKGRDKKHLTQWAATLDQYNNGLIGPGHCSE